MQLHCHSDAWPCFCCFTVCSQRLCLLLLAQMLLRLPLPGWLPAVPPAGLAVDFKWLLRRLCLALGLAATVCVAVASHAEEKDNLR